MILAEVSEARLTPPSGVAVLRLGALPDAGTLPYAPGRPNEPRLEPGTSPKGLHPRKSEEIDSTDA